MYHRDRYGNKKGSPIKKFFGIVLVLVTIILLMRLVGSNRNTSVISPIPDEKKEMTPLLAGLFAKKKSPEDLKKRIQETVNNRWKNYSVYIKDYHSPFTVGINETVIFTAASVNKVPIIAAVYYYAGKGEIDLDERVTIQTRDIQDFGTGSIRYDSPGSVYAIKTLAKLAIEQSDNTAAYVLGTYTVGFEKIQALMDEWGLTQTDMVNNKTSNRDISILFEKIYNGGVANAASTQEMLAFFKDTDFEDRLPALLPKTVSVYHKIGNEIAIMHDAGLIIDGKMIYYIGVFTSDITDGEESKKIIAEISKVVYDYLKR